MCILCLFFVWSNWLWMISTWLHCVFGLCYKQWLKQNSDFAWSNGLWMMSTLLHWTYSLCLLDFGIKCFHAISMWRRKSGSVKRPYVRWWQYISLQTRVTSPERLALHLWWKRWCACTLRWVDDDLVALCQLKVDVDCIICAHHLSFVLHEIIAWTHVINFLKFCISWRTD